MYVLMQSHLYPFSSNIRSEVGTTVSAIGSSANSLLGETPTGEQGNDELLT